MQPIKLSEDVVAVGKFKAEMAAWLKKTKEGRGPVVITQNGEPAGVLVSPAVYDEMQERERFLEAVARGIADADAGRISSPAAVRKRLAKRRAGRAVAR
jgi:prevent-host-death family protein